MIADLPGSDGRIDVAVELTGTMSFAYDVNDIGLATGRRRDAVENQARIVEADVAPGAIATVRGQIGTTARRLMNLPLVRRPSNPAAPGFIFA
jgi:hypothetical protein